MKSITSNFRIGQATRRGSKYLFPRSNAKTCIGCDNFQFLVISRTFKKLGNESHGGHLGVTAKPNLKIFEKIFRQCSFIPSDELKL